MDNKVALREVEEGDLNTFYKQQLDPEATQMAGFPAREHDAFMAHWKKVMAEEATILRTIVYREEIAGNIASWVESGDCCIGYWLGKGYWGKGIASAALKHFLKQSDTRPLFAHVARQNIASMRVLEKSGFRVSRDSRHSGVGDSGGGECVMRLD